MHDHGKRTAFDVADEAPWMGLTGLRVERVVPRFAVHDSAKLVGAEVEIGGATIRIDAVADELEVDVEPER